MRKRIISSIIECSSNPRRIGTRKPAIIDSGFLFTLKNINNKTINKYKTMKTILKPYTEKETNAIYDLWYDKKSTMEERTNYALSIGRTFTQCASKASYEKTKRMNGKPSRPYPLINVDLEEIAKQQHPAEIIVTKVIEAPLRNAIINIGVATIEISSKTFHVNGIKIDW